MTLTALLEIERRLLTDPDELGLRFAEALWISEGSPVRGNELCRTIERILRTCEREGVHYPAVLLRRKKELERGTWKPRPATPNIYATLKVAAPPQVCAPSQSSSQAVRACKICGGSGIVKSADGQTGRACECFLHWTPESSLA